MFNNRTIFILKFTKTKFIILIKCSQCSLMLSITYCLKDRREDKKTGGRAGEKKGDDIEEETCEKAGSKAGEKTEGKTGDET